MGVTWLEEQVPKHPTWGALLGGKWRDKVSHYPPDDSP